MGVRISRISRFSGRGQLNRNGEKVSDIRDVLIEEYQQVKSETGDTPPERVWVEVSFRGTESDAAFLTAYRAEHARDTGERRDYSVRALGQLDSGETKVAEVSGISLDSPTNGNGRLVTYGNVN